MDKDNALVVFQGKKIRRTWFNDEWWFSVVDIVEALTESGRARKVYMITKDGKEYLKSYYGILREQLET